MKTKTLLLSCLLITGAMATSTTDANVSKGSTLDFKYCYKPGAPVDMSYESTKVQAGEAANVNVKLITTLSSGEIEVTVDLDDGLISDGEIQTVYKLTILPDEKEHTLNFRVLAQEDGLYYIRLLAKVESGDGARIRAFAIPIYVGDAKLKRKSKQIIMKALGGENISVSKAQETIEIIEDK